MNQKFERSVLGDGTSLDLFDGLFVITQGTNVVKLDPRAVELLLRQSQAACLPIEEEVLLLAIPVPNVAEAARLLGGLMTSKVLEGPHDLVGIQLNPNVSASMLTPMPRDMADRFLTPQQ